MPKSTNISLNFDTTTANTATSNSSTVTINSFYCKYYLPCGKCDKTGELCTHYNPVPIYPTYPYRDWWWWGPTWTCETKNED